MHPQVGRRLEQRLQSQLKAADKAEAKLAKEKTAMIGTKKKGMYGTILTSGKGVEDEATTSSSLLGGKKV